VTLSRVSSESRYNSRQVSLRVDFIRAGQSKGREARATRECVTSNVSGLWETDGCEARAV
jgi:hypothetical protein